MADEKTTAEPIAWAADLLAPLEASGTGPTKLTLVKDAMAKKFAARPDLADDDPRRHLSGEEAVALLERNLGGDHGTAAKARALVATGRLPPPPKEAVHPAAALPPPPRGKKPVAGFAETAPPAESPRPAGAPGVVDLSTPALPTIGPKPVKAKGGAKDLIPRTEPPTG